MYKSFYKSGITDVDFQDELLEDILSEILELKVKDDYFLKGG